MHGLIKDQKVRIDSHGHSIKNWNDEEYDIHIDKSYCCNKNKYRIRIPINSNREITIEINDHRVKPHPNDSSNDCNIFDELHLNELKKEVHDLFDDEKARTIFVHDLMETIYSYNYFSSSKSGNSEPLIQNDESKKFSKEKQNEIKAKQALGNLKRIFDLNYSRATIKGWIKGELKLYAKLFSESNSLFYIVIDLRKNSFIIGENMGYAKLFNEIEGKFVYKYAKRSKLEFEYIEGDAED